MISLSDDPSGSVIWFRLTPNSAVVRFVQAVVCDELVLGQESLGLALRNNPVPRPVRVQHLGSTVNEDAKPHPVQVREVPTIRDGLV